MRKASRFIVIAVLIAVAVAISTISVEAAAKKPRIAAGIVGSTPVSYSGRAVTAVFYANNGQRLGFAIEDVNRTAGIRVLATNAVAVGNIVNVRGTLVNADGEKAVQASSVTKRSGSNVLKPLMARNRDIGGGANAIQPAVVDDINLPADYLTRMSKGINNVGILMTIRGEVTKSVSTGNYDGYFYVNDSTEVTDICEGTYEMGLNDGSGNFGIKCRPSAGQNNLAAPLPKAGDYVEVTGVVGIQQIEGQNARYFWTTSWTPAQFAEYSVEVPAQGMNLISLPAQPQDPDPAAVFEGTEIDGRLYRWEAYTQGLSAYDVWGPYDFGTITSTAGFWFNADTPTMINYTGYVDSAQQDRWISTPKGWSIIGNPFDHSTYWADWKVTDGNTVKTIQQARGNWLDSAILGWDPFAQTLVKVGLHCDQPVSQQLDPGCGYWIYTKQDVALIAPAASIAL